MGKHGKITLLLMHFPDALITSTLYRELEDTFFFTVSLRCITDLQNSIPFEKKKKKKKKKKIQY